MTVAAASDRAAQPRPLPVLFVYSWDMLRALMALFAALAAFSGGITVGGRDVAVPTYAQVILALGDVAFAASLIIVAAVLTRHQRWVRDVQIWSLVIAIVLIIASIPAQRISDAPSLISAAVMILIDIAAVVAMLSRSARRWYAEPGRVPKYVTWCLVFWAATGATVVLYMAAGVR